MTHGLLSAELLSDRSVSVTTFGRLHLGFFDLSHHSARKFGSMGVSIDAFQTRLTACFGKTVSSEPWLDALLQRHMQRIGSNAEICLQLHQAIPRHSGLGSGTQMALAIGAAVNTLLELPVIPEQIAATHERGARSGIGIATFLHGGLVVDGGRGPATSVPPLLAHHDFPSEWCFLLMMPDDQVGIHGQQEKTAFKTLQPRPLADTQMLAHQLLMQALPALAERDFEGFASFVGALQDYNGAYFSPAQGGQYASPAIAQVIDDLKQQGHISLGQTSWGPTGFILLPSMTTATALQNQLSMRYSSFGLSFLITKAINHGAGIDVQV